MDTVFAKVITAYADTLTIEIEINGVIKRVELIISAMSKMKWSELGKAISEALSVAVRPIAEEISSQTGQTMQEVMSGLLAQNVIYTLLCQIIKKVI